MDDDHFRGSITTSGDYALEPGPEARGVAVEGTQATLMHLTAALANPRNADLRELPINHGLVLSFASPGSNASVADAVLESKRT